MTIPPIENASREDLEKAKQMIIARLDAMDQEHREGMEGLRQQNSAEHGALQSSLISIRETLHWLRAQWQKFTKP